MIRNAEPNVKAIFLVSVANTPTPPFFPPCFDCQKKLIEKKENCSRWEEGGSEKWKKKRSKKFSACLHYGSC